jgi:para-aminobenzoate synthetase/4-amino-4-deoxychorismate lyase
VDEQRFQVILRTPWRGPWRRFSRPVRVVVAREPGQVRDALREVDGAVREGNYAAGFVTYEAAGGFGFAVHGHLTNALPLVAFGIFAPESVEPLYRPGRGGEVALGEWTPSISHADYLRAVGMIKSHIQSGDTYQINFTFRLDASFDGDVQALMRSLYISQRGPWSAFVDADTHVICSASPELFFRVNRDRIMCRPMKGTWARGFWPAQDGARGEALRASAKNRAENVMIVDMVRNDLGRIAATGSVQATSMYDVERYPLQWQMTSTVEAELRGASLDRLFEAMFPCGSITGAPKHRSMEIIRELETTPRGIYTGAIGYLSPNGRSHFSVAIRTVVVDRSSRRAQFGVGSGIVWDSVDRDEYEECVLKAAILGSSGSVGSIPSPGSAGSASYVVDDPRGFRLLETMRWAPDAGFALLERHLQRLRESAACFGFACDTEEVRGLLNEAVQDLRGPAKVRVMLEDDGDVLCEAVDLVAISAPVRIAFANEPVRRSDVFLYHKTTKRDVYDRARAGRPDADAVVLWNEDGQVTEATESNVVMLRDGVRMTPPIDAGLLPGTMRADLLESGEIVEGEISKADFQSAERIWLINSVRGWLEATWAGQPPAG